MAEIRALFIIQNKSIVFSQRFPSVEKKLKLLVENEYIPLPNDYQLNFIFNEVNTFIFILVNQKIKIKKLS